MVVNDAQIHVHNIVESMIPLMRKLMPDKDDIELYDIATIFVVCKFALKDQQISLFHECLNREAQ